MPLKTHVGRVDAAGLCTQCGTCAGICPADAVEMRWELRHGWRVVVDDARCTDCGACLESCPGESFDFRADAPWRARNQGGPIQDFLGPWRGLWFGWATDPDVRHRGASGGVATAVLQAALTDGLPGEDGERVKVDAVIGARIDPANALAVRPVLAATAAEAAACRGSKYNAVAMNEALAQVRERPGRYVLVGLPCHIQGLRLAQRRSHVLRERVVFALGIFCGWTAQPRATEIAARQAGVDPADLATVTYRGPGWPGGMRLVRADGSERRRPYPDYFDRFMGACTPPRCRLCPDALAECADVSVGDAWLERFEHDPAFAEGVSDVIARTPLGERTLDELAAGGRLSLLPATPDGMVTSQSEAVRIKRHVLRGRLWLRRLAGRPVPDYPGLDLEPSPSEVTAGLRDAAEEALFRAVGDLRYR
jgi:coenzyme F420 hydrogenase subunit beta